MRLALPLVILGVAAAALMLTPAEARIAGLNHGTLAGVAGCAALLAYYLVSVRPSDVARMVSSIAVWALLLAVLAGVYAYRYEASDFVDRMTEELMPSEPATGQGGEAIVGRRLGGEFAVTAHINGTRATLLFDTGASMVVLTAADARRAGINTASLGYDVPVTTANGSAMAAEVRLDQISVGPIAMRKVPALVAKPGALEESLLGMSFLERLKSFEVERGKLIMTAK
jgi:aspartyl protease family protein